MNLLFQYLTVVTLCLIAFSSSAQENDSQSVIKRYEKITRLDKLTPEDMQSVMMDVKYIIKESFHVDMRTIMSIKDTAKVRIDIKALGEKVEIVIDGKKGWVSGIPTMGIESIPEDALTLFGTMLNLNRNNYLWSNSLFFSSKMVAKLKRMDELFKLYRLL